MGWFKDRLLSEMPMATGADVGLVLDDQDPLLFVLVRPGPNLTKGLRTFDFDAIGDAIAGVMAIRHNEKFDAIEVDKVWAEHGYGPLLYRIAMTYAGPKGMISSRVTGQVTPEALAVWQRFATDPEVVATPLDSDYQHHPHAALMSRYVLRNPHPLTAMLRKGVQAIGRDPHNEKKINLLEIAEAKLRGQMDDIYGDGNG